MSLEEIKKKIKEIENSEPAIFGEDGKDLVEILEKDTRWDGLCDEWATASGFVYNEEEVGWVDSENGNRFCGQTAQDVIYNGGYELDLLYWAFSSDECLREEILEEWRNGKIKKLLETPEAQEAISEEAAKRWNLEKNQVLANLQTHGRIGTGLRNAIFGWKTDVFDLEDPETGKWLVPKLLAVSNHRHTMTGYDQIDKSHMDEFEVDELRREANRGSL